MIFAILCTSGCSGQTKTEELKLGKYVMQDSEVEDWAYVILSDGNKFEFNRNLATSYRPMGTYSVEDNILVLKADLNEVYTFKINDGELIFNSGDMAKDLVEVGAVFKWTKEK